MIGTHFKLDCNRDAANWFRIKLIKIDTREENENFLFKKINKNRGTKIEKEDALQYL